MREEKLGTYVRTAAEQESILEKEFRMLVLTRKAGQKIVVPECELAVTILEIRRNRVRVGISAPVQLAIHREESWLRVRGKARSLTRKGVGHESFAG